jgi:large subunit ribosomal protein L15
VKSVSCHERENEMFSDLHTIRGTVRRRKRRVRGRGNGSGRGGMSGGGGKGESNRSGNGQRLFYEGGQVPLYRKSPIRGFSRGKFLNKWIPVSLDKISYYFEDGEEVSLETMKDKRLIPANRKARLKILNVGTLTKKVSFRVHGISAGVEKVLKEKSIELIKISE